MMIQLTIGTVVIVATVLIAAVFVNVAIWGRQRFGFWIVRQPHNRKFVAVLTVTILWVQAASTVFTWLWALVYLAVGAFSTLEEAVYFSIVSFTTLGFGDILLPEKWRLLSGMAAANGLLMFGFFTAFIVEMMRRVRGDQTRGYPETE